jgi:glycyl-tRNA synthetase beta chain
MAKTADLLFELGTEELPPTALARLSDALLSEFRNGLDANAIEYSAIEAFAAPRRLAILVTDCLVQQPDVTVNRRGPAVQAAFDKVGQPTKAATGFAASCNTTVDQLDRTATDKGEWLSFNVVQKGRETAELLPAIAEAALDKLPIPKRMRWGDSTAMFVRPVHWLVFLLGENIVPCRLLDTDSNRFTYGHRFHHPAAIELSHPQEYLNKLRAEGKVIANFEERRLLISEQVAAAASQLGGQIAHDADLLDEVTALVEWPVPIVGEFEESFLAVPHEALIMTMKKNQKYFPVFDSSERLLNRFIAIANIESSKPDTIRSGNERVIRPRLADAKFFWDQDARITLEGRLEKLADIVFQQQLGSILDKSQRVSELASLIASQIGGDPSLAARAGLLSRCDLVTEMVFEFPEMQGIMGRYQAGRDGEDSEVALAMDEIYMPRFSGDELPSSKTGIAVALADRIDTLTGIFGINLKPSGTKDPFALRRAALGIIRIMREYSLTLNLSDLIGTAYKLLKDRLENEATISDVVEFINERLKGVFIDAGFSANLVKAVASVNPADIPDFEKRLQAVKTFSELPQSDQLAAANKRISNILKKIDGPVPQVSDAGLSDSDHERALFSAVSEKQQSTRSLLDKFDYQSVLLDLAQSSTVIDEFFEHVMVMADDEKIRLNRLALLNDVRNLFLEVADISVLQDV